VINRFLWEILPEEAPPEQMLTDCPTKTMTKTQFALKMQ
jgi:hypothetical protein